MGYLLFRCPTKYRTNRTICDMIALRRCRWLEIDTIGKHGSNTNITPFLLWQLVVLLRTVIGAKKCLFAAGPGAHVVAYVCATGGKTLKVLNGGGDGGSLLELSALRPEDLGGSGKPKRGGEVIEVHKRSFHKHKLHGTFSHEELPACDLTRFKCLTSLISH